MLDETHGMVTRLMDGSYWKGDAAVAFREQLESRSLESASGDLITLIPASSPDTNPEWRSRVHPSDHPTAWEHPPTRRAWAKQMTISTLAFIGWFLSPWCSLLVLLAFYSPVLLPFVVLLMGYGMYRTCIQPLQIFFNLRIRRLLRAYSWHLDDFPFSLSPHPEASSTDPWFEFPHPGRPGEHIPMYLHLHYRSSWWSRRMGLRAKPELKSQLKPIWFAGDPRFFGVIAVTRPGSDPGSPEPKRLHLLVQIGDTKKTAPIDVNPWQAAPEDLAHARQAVGWRGPRD